MQTNFFTSSNFKTEKYCDKARHAHDNDCDRLACFTTKTRRVLGVAA